MECPHCGAVNTEDNLRCKNCGGALTTVWPPPLAEEVETIQKIDTVGESLHLGYRLLILGIFCPAIFLPLAAWQGLQANRLSRTGAGSLVLILSASVAALEIAGLSLVIFLRR